MLKFAILTSVLGASVSCAQVVTFSFTGSAGDEATFDPDAQPANGIVTSISRGSGLNPVTSAGAFNSSGFSTGALDADDYYTFSIEPAVGFHMTLTRVEVDERRSGTGIRDWAIYSSVDGFTTPLASFNVPDSTATRTDQGVDLGAGSFSDLSAPVEFRFYGFTAEAAAGTWRLDNVDVFGSFVAVPVPEPGEYTAMTGALLLGLGVWRRVRRTGS